MNILLINHYVGAPKYGMEFRPYFLGKEWVKQGHNVTIIGASYSHLRYSQPEKGDDFREEIIDGIRYVWVNTPIYKSSFKRIINILCFVIKILFKSKKIASLFSPDIVINSSTYPLDIYPAMKIAEYSNAKLIYEVHDLWPLSPIEIGGYSKFHPYILLLQKAENDAYKYSYKVVSLLGNAKQHMIDHGMRPQKFIHIPNGYDKNEWDSKCFMDIPEEHSFQFRKLKDEKKFIIGFSGGHTPSTAMDTFIDSANMLKHKKEFAFVLVGDGVSKDSLIDRCKGYNLSNVFFLPPVNKKQIPKLVENFDIAYLGGVHSILHKYGTSANKMTDYMLCRKPILFSVDEPNSVIEKVNCGIRVNAEDSKSVTDAVLTFHSMSLEERKEMGERGYTYAINNLGYDLLAYRFIEEIFI